MKKDRRNKFLIGQQIAQKVFNMETLPLNIVSHFGYKANIFTSELEVGKSKRAIVNAKKKAINVHKMTVGQLPTLLDPLEIENLQKAFDTKLAEKNAELASQENEIFLPTDRRKIIDIFAHHGYRIVYGTNTDAEERLQMMFVNCERAFLITDDWHKKKAFILDFAILHNANFKVRWSQNINWREYLRISHRRSNEDELYDSLVQIIVECNQMWNQIEEYPKAQNSIKITHQGKELDEIQWQEKIQNALVKIRAAQWKEEKKQKVVPFDHYLVYQRFRDQMAYSRTFPARCYNIYALYLLGSASLRANEKEPVVLPVLTGKDKMLEYHKTFMKVLNEIFG